jgi:hypothetical protein
MYSVINSSLSGSKVGHSPGRPFAVVNFHGAGKVEKIDSYPSKAAADLARLSLLGAAGAIMLMVGASSASAATVTEL